MKLALGFVLAFLIGAACKWFDLPAPAPPALTGALLVVSMSLGYMSVGEWQKRRELPANSPPAATQRESQTTKGS